MNTKRLFSAVLVAYFVTVGCSSSDNNPVAPTKDPPPTFTIASVKVQFADGSDGILFFARPDKDVVLVKVVITPPAGDKITFNAGNTTVVAGEDIALQDPNIAYIRISGEWRFVFTGNLATGDKSSFEVTATVSVGA